MAEAALGLTSHGNRNRVGDMSEAYILIQSDLGDAAVVAELAGAIPGVLVSEIVAGPYDVIVRAQAYDVDELFKRVVSPIQAIRSVMRTVTCIIGQPGSRWQLTSPARTRRTSQYHGATSGSLAKPRQVARQGPFSRSNSLSYRLVRIADRK